ncbi:MAG: PepSY domain-containing protein [Emcibacteraceae bacterium]|nr:PepSY domain-containing protein [Emcibacteraceae bacterium]
MKSNKFINFKVILICALFSNFSAMAQEIGSNSLSRDEVNTHLKDGNVLSYEFILSQIPRNENDRIIEAELVSYDGLLIYHFEILKENGVVETHLIDGKTGKDATYLRDQ